MSTSRAEVWKGLMEFFDRIFDGMDQGCTPIFVWNVPDEFTKEFDTVITQPNYSGETLSLRRSKAIYDLMQKAVQDKKK